MTVRSRESRNFSIEDCHIPVDVFYEARRNVRVALGRDKVLLRIPRYCTTRERQKYHAWCEQWIADQWLTNPRFKATFLPFDLDQYSAFQVGDIRYALILGNADTRPTVRLAHEEIRLSLPPSYSVTMRNTSGYKLINQALGRAYQPVFLERAHALHHAHSFSKPVVSLSFRNMSSKWGSCSHSGRLSLSTRLLFAPGEVQRYVLVHELCHLDELNHSERFWKRVEGIMPKYREHEAWLRTHGHLCDLKFAGTVQPESPDEPGAQLQLF